MPTKPKENLRRRLGAAGFLVLLLGAAAFLAVTDSDMGSSQWQRWTTASQVSAATAQDPLL